ncbi:SLAC1 anion channel family protein [Spirosoma spitsbergense]|uniref:SLAC1 anion channel family protein n=1 Tax=Spirosoma spitsbergense TaxID=431554 RepID=UPI00036C483C|nr:SLAC1 anion channel family protein [Spirosoma spitsbergense]
MKTVNPIGLQTIPESPADKKSTDRPLSRLPVNLFASVVSLAGLTVDWRLSAHLFGTDAGIADVLGLTAWIVFIGLSIGYGLKAFRYPQQVIGEFKHPVIGSFFGTIPISILLLANSVIPYSLQLAGSIWLVGAMLMIAMSFLTTYRLITSQQNRLNATPVWLISGAGTFNIAVTGGSMTFGAAGELMLLGFSVGIGLALIFLTLIFSRLVFEDGLEQSLKPSLFMLTLPFSLAFQGYHTLTHRIDLFNTVLYYFALFLFAVVVYRVINFRLPFTLSWWGMGFPIAALCKTAFEYAIYKPTILSRSMAVILLIGVTLLVGYMVLRTLYGLITSRLP